MPKSNSHILRSEADGYLFPIPHRFVERIFSDNKDVFVKLSMYRLLTKGKTLVFYDSGGEIHAVVGQAKIKQTIYADPDVIWKELGPRIFLNKDEFDQYVEKSPLGPRLKKKKMTAFILEQTKKYSEPRKPDKRVTPAGYYLP